MCHLRMEGSGPPFGKVSTHCCLSLKMETSLDHHDLSKVIETGLTMMLANFLSICGCLPSGLRDLCMSNLSVPYPLHKE